MEPTGILRDGGHHREEDAGGGGEWGGQHPIQIQGGGHHPPWLDDILGLTLTGYKASLFNSHLNVHTADKQLQFGPQKCKYINISKSSCQTQKSYLDVDHWDIIYDNDNSII